MFFDDRLATVLRQRATGEAGLRTQFRQLLDLLGKDQSRRGSASDLSLLAAAWLRIDALAKVIPADERARMIREPGWRFNSPDLASHLADHEPEVASAALNRADLSSEDWTALIPHLPVRARGLLRNRRDLPVDVDALLARLGVYDRGLPAPEPAATPMPTIAIQSNNDAPDPTSSVKSITARIPVTVPRSIGSPSARDRDDDGRTEISALVERIAQFRRERGESAQEFERSPRLPLGEMAVRPDLVARHFGFATDASGRIEWASSDVAPMVIGTRLFAPSLLSDTDGGARGLERAFLHRQTIMRGVIGLAGAPAIAGDWLMDAQPRFGDEGHFIGYFGRLRRMPGDLEAPLPAEAFEADRIRQLLHELRTPITAVQGYAEVIQQQLFGPAPHEYRALAAAIAADAARVLSGFDELDRLARLETGAMRIEPGEADCAELVRRTIDQLVPVLEPRNVAIFFDYPASSEMLVAIDPDDAEALMWRLLASLAATCGADEQIALRLDPLIGGGTPTARLTCTLPARLAAEDNLFATTVRQPESAINAGLFGTGFALRLARAEACGAGGSLVRDGSTLTLSLPLVARTLDRAEHNRDIALTGNY